MDTIATEWAQLLGLSTSPLFARPTGSSAMLDGVAGSFVLSEDNDCGRHLGGADLSWSSMMRHHVAVTADKVAVANSSAGKVETITRTSVENDLEGFLSYLERPSGRVPIDVVDHVVRSFQALRAVVAAPAPEQLKLFLYLLAVRLKHPDAAQTDMAGVAAQWSAEDLGFDVDLPDLARRLPDADRLDRFYTTLLTDDYNGREVYLDLTVRHAGAELFQAAQLAPPVEDPQGSLLGLTRYRVRPHSLKDVAYTPVGLARSISEQAIYRSGKQPGDPLVVVDPTCGSGSFLVEALRALKRMNWVGSIRLHGFDISPEAAISARFAVSCAVADNPDMDVKYEIRCEDYLAANKVPSADIVLMNPPYKGWPMMTDAERKALREALGGRIIGRPDYSLAFVQKAVENAGGDAVVAALLPVGVLSGISAAAWRERLLALAQPEVVALFGDHSLFRHAMVNVVAVMLKKSGSPAPIDGETAILWASERRGAASSALRTLRRVSRSGMTLTGFDRSDDEAASDWNIYSVPTQAFVNRPNWLPAPRAFSSEAMAILEDIPTRVTDLFDVSLGIRAGSRSAFVISAELYRSLPDSEQVGFQPVAEKAGITAGTITSSHYLFVGGENVETEDELVRTFPAFYDKHLSEHKAALLGRKKESKWWQLARSRGDVRNRSGPRILSREWIKNDGFAIDWTGRYAALGKSWFPRNKLWSAGKAAGFEDRDTILRLYEILFNSDVFFAVLREHSTKMGGGQLDLQKKYLNYVPLPVLNLNSCTQLPTNVSRDEPLPPLQVRNEFAQIMYGLPPGEITV